MKTHRLSICIMGVFLFMGLLFGGCGDSNNSDSEDGGGSNNEETNYDLDNFPEKADPRKVGEKLVERFINTGHSYWGNITSTNIPNHVTYPDVCAWMGAFWFAESVGSNELYNKLVDRFDPLFTTEKNMQPSLRPSASNIVDYYVFGAIPLEIYKKKQENQYLELGMKYADGQWTLPSNATQEQKDWSGDDYSWQTRLWIDDMYMITTLQAQAYLATGDEKYIDRTAREMVLYLDRLQRDNGLFYHAPDAPFFWGRGNGWMAVGMADVLRMLPQTTKYDPYREKIMKGYKKMMEALLQYQQPSGMWGQLIDLNTWPETSGTGMFTYAMIVGVKNGWLDEKKYGAAARKAWITLQEYFTLDYDIRNVCEGTGAKNSYDWYINRRRWTGDRHGQAALLWCSYALTMPSKKK